MWDSVRGTLFFLPFGCPVLPEANTTYAAFSGPERRLNWGRGPPNPSRLMPRRPSAENSVVTKGVLIYILAVVLDTKTCEVSTSRAMSASRPAGWAGSKRMNPPPTLSTESKAIMAQADFSTG